MLKKKRRSEIVISEELIAQRAFEIWQARGCPEGGDGQEDWQTAEEQLRLEATAKSRPLLRFFSRLRNRAALA